MKALKIAGVVLLAAIAGFVVIGLALPKAVHMERATLIQAPASVIYEFVADVRMQQEWNPWRAKDPSMQTVFSENTRGVGAWYSWKGEKSGEGKLTVTKEEPFESIEESLDFGDMGLATSTWFFHEAEGETHVVWGFDGVNENIIGRYFGLMMDSMLGPDYEAGLANLKRVAEQAAAKAEAAKLEAEAAAAAAATTETSAVDSTEASEIEATPE